MPQIFLLILIFILALISFFFSASETAVIGLSKIRLRHLIQKGIKRAKSVERVIKSLDKFIAAILIGNDLVNIAISAIVTAIFISIFGYKWGVAIATFISTLFVLTFCEITPKILATKYTEKIALFTSPLMETFIRIFHPVIKIFTQLSNFILRCFKISPPKRSPLITEEEIRLMIEIGKEEGVLTDEERRLLHRIFEFGDTKVSEVMVPKEKIVAIDIESSSDRLLDLLVEEGHARIPVFKDSIENIIGIIYIRDLLYMIKNKGLIVLGDLIHPAYYVSPLKKVNELLKEFQQKRIQIAIITDDRRRVLGLVTLEDLIEEIVGEIEEEQTKI